MSDSMTPLADHGPTAGELVAVWRVLRHGGVDESLNALPIPPALSAFLPTAIASLRWATVLFGMVFAEPRAVDGDAGVVGSLAILLFLSSWRSWRPLRLGSHDPLDRTVAITDAALAGIAIAWSGTFLSPFAPAAIALPVLAAFGWGAIEGLLSSAALVGAAVMFGFTIGRHPLPTGRAWWGATALVVTVGAAIAARRAAFAAEVRRAALSGQVETLTDANDLLSVLARVARTLPNAYNLPDALDRVRLQLVDTFRPRSILLVSPAGDGLWRAEITDGVDAPPLIPTDALPARLLSIVDGSDARGSAEALATPLRARGALVGLLLLEADPQLPYAERHQRLLVGLADVLALTIDNGRLFGRLRSFGAEAERNRIARDLHDRLGQWLTYIGLELERIMRHDGTAQSDDIDRLHHDVQSAMTELRETLRDLRTTISAERGFDVVATEVLARFRERTGLATVIDITTPGARLDLETEHELLRILQEALHNIDKHAAAKEVDVRWAVTETGARLQITDDGRGFDQDSPRSGSFGLVGMRERAVGIGASLDIQSRPGAGTTVVVETTMEQVR